MKGRPKKPECRQYRIKFIAILLVAVLNLFGVRSHLQQYSDEIGQKILSSFHKSDAQKEITVVLIDEDYMRALEKDGKAPNWPLPNTLLVNSILKPIISAGPKALFIDLFFSDNARQIDRRNDDTQNKQDAAIDLGERIHELRESHIPVFLADATFSSDHSINRDRQIDFTNAQLIQHTRVLSNKIVHVLFPASTECNSSRSESMGDFEVVNSGWYQNGSSYPLLSAVVQPGISKDGNCGDSRSPKDEGFLASPALALFARYCSQENLRLPDNDTLCEKVKSQEWGTSGYRLYHGNPDELRPMSLLWGDRPSPAIQNLYAGSTEKEKCRPQFERNPWVDAVAIFAGKMLPWLQTRDTIDTDRRCPYIDAISASDIRLYSTERNIDIPSSFIKGRYIFLGVSLEEAKDHIVSPVQGELPGVYLHATAFENLLNYGDGYHRLPTEFEEHILDVVEAAYVVLIIWLWNALQYVQANEPKKLKNLGVLVTVLFLIVFVVVTILISLFLWQGCNLPLANYIFIVAAGFTAIVTDLVDIAAAGFVYLIGKKNVSWIETEILKPLPNMILSRVFAIAPFLKKKPKPKQITKISSLERFPQNDLES